MQNVNTSPASIESVIRSAAFSIGYADAINDIPFRYDFPPGNVGFQNLYEQGRILGQLFRGPLRKGGKINPAAINTISDNLELF